LRIGCVSYLNARPLIEGLDDRPDTQVKFDVPSGLLNDLESGEVDIALCPVIDYFKSHQSLKIVPVGGIGSAGATLTVQLYSQVPIDQIQSVYADTDSHTSVVLLRVVLHQMYNLSPTLIDYQARENVADVQPAKAPKTMLLIGDKVIVNEPSRHTYPYQLDLGQAWLDMTGLPFVFAVWMAKQECSLGELPQLLDQQRKINLTKLDEIADQYASTHHWPADLARQYLGQYMQYNIGPEQLEAIARFGELAASAGLIDHTEPLVLHE
jgi:chorismate dehydratase